MRAVAHARARVELRDLAAFGRPARLVWCKRRWRCEEPLCAVGTWTETSPAFSSRCLLTRRAGLEACRQVGLNARPVRQLADELGVCWDTVMDAVWEYGQPLVDDPDRVGVVAALGVDETAFLKATQDHPTIYATGLVDLDERIVIDVVASSLSARSSIASAAMVLSTVFVKLGDMLDPSVRNSNLLPSRRPSTIASARSEERRVGKECRL